MSRITHQMARSRKELTDEEIAQKLGPANYGSFRLSEAARMTSDAKITLSEGYRTELYHDQETGHQTPVLVCAASYEKLYALFCLMLRPFGNELVNLVLESTHMTKSAEEKNTYHYENIDPLVLRHLLCPFEDDLVHDGNLGLSVYHPDEMIEVQWDEHKVLMVYALDLEPFREIAQEMMIPERPEMFFLFEGEHMHGSSGNAFQRFRELRGVLRDR